MLPGASYFLILVYFGEGNWCGLNVSISQSSHKIPAPKTVVLGVGAFGDDRDLMNRRKPVIRRGTRGWDDDAVGKRITW